MERKIIEVPENIRYISEWPGFNLPDHPCIINKKITGCGFTEYCITNNQNLILCSPRKILLENKEEQHQNSVLYVKNELEADLTVDKDLTTIDKSHYHSRLTIDPVIDMTEIIENEKKQIMKMRQSVEAYFYNCLNTGIPCKFLVTYDSFHIVKDVLLSLSAMDKFYIVVDEFQSILTDAKFKSSTEIEFLYQLQGINNLCFVSATPLLDEYIERLEQFNKLPYYELDWETRCPGRVSSPVINVHYCPRGIIGPAREIIEKYKSGEFEVTTTKVDGELIETVSKEAVIYVNSVKNICDIIRRCDLTIDNTNVLCAKTPENEKKVRKAFRVSKSTKVLGTIPTKGEPHKMFTLCTRTVYLGADFYSTCARTFIFSDANIDSLTVDIKLDLPQILGRQRLESNPWKNRAELYCKTLKSGNIITPEESKKIVDSKVRETENLLSIYGKATDTEKQSLAKKYKSEVELANYKNDYVAVNTRGGKDLIPVKNDLVMINDERAFRIQQIDYKDLAQVFTALGKSVREGDEIRNIISQVENIKYFHNKMKYLYSLEMPDNIAKGVLDGLGDSSFSKYYWTISPSRAGTLGYQKGNLEAEYNSCRNSDGKILEEVYKTFQVGSKYSKSVIKSELQKIYDNCGQIKVAKANDLEKYFDIKTCQITNKETGKRDMAYEIVKKKED